MTNRKNGSCMHSIYFVLIAKPSENENFGWVFGSTNCRSNSLYCEEAYIHAMSKITIIVIVLNAYELISIPYSKAKNAFFQVK